jgi:hypothetical protein
MTTYEPPVNRLTQLGRPSEPTERWVEYSSFGIGPEHIPEVIRLLRDQELAWSNEDTPGVYAQVHAWRVLGQLKAGTAVEPLLDLLAGQETEDWNDWVTEEVPHVLGMIGPPVIPAAAARLEQSRRLEHAPTYYADALAQVARQHPESRDDVVARLTSFLGAAAENNPLVNAFVISDLIDLKAVDSWPVIEKAFVIGEVDESIVGGPADVKWRLGLGPEPPRSAAWRMARSAGLTAKDRAQQRAKKRKADKRKTKRGR